MNFVPPALSCSSFPFSRPSFLPILLLQPSCSFSVPFSCSFLLSAGPNSRSKSFSSRTRVRSVEIANGSADFFHARDHGEQTKQPCPRNRGVRNNFLLRYEREKLLAVIAADSRGNGRYSARKCMYILRIRKFVVSPEASEQEREGGGVGEREKERETFNPPCVLLWIVQKAHDSDERVARARLRSLHFDAYFPTFEFRRVEHSPRIIYFCLIVESRSQTADNAIWCMNSPANSRRVDSRQRYDYELQHVCFVYLCVPYESIFMIRLYLIVLFYDMFARIVRVATRYNRLNQFRRHQNFCINRVDFTSVIFYSG